MKNRKNGNLEKLTRTNNKFRKIIYTDRKTQLVLMSLKIGEEIGRERHIGHTQFIRIEKGKCRVYLGTTRFRLKSGDYVIIPPGVYHNVINTGTSALKLYTLYSPPVH